MRSFPGWYCFVLVLAAATVTGCGSGGKVPLKGKVVANGQPVTEGTLMFAPLASAETSDTAAAPALGQIQPDGTFTAGTESASDGVVAGRYQVAYNAPLPPPSDWDGYGARPVVKQSPFMGLVPKQSEIEVSAGENELTIELVKGRN